MQQVSLPSYRFEFILSDRIFYVRDEKELALIFELLSKTNTPELYHWNVIMSLDEKLHAIMQTPSGLLQCLKYLSNKNRFLFFFKVADILPKLIGGVEGFARILASIPDSYDQEKFIKMLRKKGLLSFVKTPRDLGKMFEWATPEIEKMMIVFLGKEFIQSIIASSRHFYDIVYLLDASNKRFFFELVGWEFLRSRAFSADDFFFALKAVELHDTDTFLGLFDPEWIRSVIPSEAAFHAYLKKLSFTKQDPLLHYLGYDPNEFNTSTFTR